MKKAASDSKVKKTLVRNYEIKAKSLSRKNVVHDAASSSNSLSQGMSSQSQKENELSQPTLCSSKAIASYISDAKKMHPTSLASFATGDLNVDKGLLCTKMTKKLNFHFNDRIYKNLVELNANIETIKSKKDKRPTTGSFMKKDLEPNIEDFYEDEKELDSPPSIPILKPKFRTLKKVEDGRLHKLVAAFEDL